MPAEQRVRGGGGGSGPLPGRRWPLDRPAVVRGAVVVRTAVVESVIVSRGPTEAALSAAAAGPVGRELAVPTDCADTDTSLTVPPTETGPPPPVPTVEVLCVLPNRLRSDWH